MKAGDAESDLKGPLNTTRAKFFSFFERSNHHYGKVLHAVAVKVANRNVRMIVPDGFP
jgi:hypothetical protein